MARQDGASCVQRFGIACYASKDINPFGVLRFLILGDARTKLWSELTFSREM